MSSELNVLGHALSRLAERDRYSRDFTLNSLTDALREGLSKRLGLRDASEEKASAIARGTIVKYEIDVPVAYSADPQQATATRRRLQIVVDVEIYDQVLGKTIWQKKSIMGEGEYSERFEAEGRKAAINRIVNEVIEGAQSQW